MRFHGRFFTGVLRGGSSREVLHDGFFTRGFPQEVFHKRFLTTGSAPEVIVIVLVPALLGAAFLGYSGATIAGSVPMQPRRDWIVGKAVTSRSNRGHSAPLTSPGRYPGTYRR